MQWLKRRWVLFGVFGALACAGEPTGNQSTPTEITANPDVVFVTQGDSQAVIVSVVDEDGQVLESNFGDPTNVGSGISVVFDPNFQTTTTGVPIHRQARYFVKGVDLAHSSFTVEALGLTKDIEVFSIPGQLNATISNTTPALGDTISITAPPGTFFSGSSVLTFGGFAPVVVSQDATTITFIPFPNIFAPAVVSNVGVESNPDVTFTLATPDSVKTDSIANLGANVAPTSPALGATVTLTLPAGLKLIPESLTTLAIANAAVAPRDPVLSADSSTITFVPPPNADSFVVVSGVIPERLAGCCATATGYSLLLGTTVKVTTPVVSNFPSTVSDATPAANDVVTVTSSDGAYTIDPAAEVLVGALAATVTSRTGNSISFVPPPGATGPVTVNGVLIGGFSLSLASSAGDLTVGALAPLSGTNREATAPTLALPGAGELTTLFDQPDFPAGFGDPVADAAGGGGTAFYKIDVPADGDYTITVNWDIGSDVDVFVCGDPIDSVAFSNCDFAAATGNQPESATYSLTAGTQNIVLNDFGGDATGATVQITIEH